MKVFVQGPWFPVVFATCAVLLVFVSLRWAIRLERKRRKPLPPSDLEKVEFLRRGNDGRLWRYHLDGDDAKMWDECLRANLRSSSGFLDLNWKREEI